MMSLAELFGLVAKHSCNDISPLACHAHMSIAKMTC